MNKERRKTLNELHSTLEQVLSELTTVRDEEQEAFDAMSERAQEGEKGQAIHTCIDVLSTALDNIENAIAEIETAKE